MQDKKTTQQLPAFLRQSQIIPDVVPVSSATFWRWVNAGKFPSPIKLSERVTAWRSDDVQAWIEAQGEAANG